MPVVSSIMVRVSLDTYILPQESFHTFRITHGPQNPLGMHAHDNFAEVFFVESGEGFHIVNNERVPLQPGSIAFCRPDDYHTVIGKDNHTNITIINTAFRAETLTYFKERYYPDCDKFFFSTEKVPFHLQVDEIRLGKLVEWAEHVIHLPWTNRTLDPFLLKICGLENTRQFAVENAEELPSWLLRAIEHYRQPAQFEQGIKGFVRLAGRSPEHINRVLRKLLNQTLSETVNAARIRYAARELAMTDKKIMAIALDCNFPSLGYFYKCFKKQYGLSPDQYRKKNRSLL